MSMYNIINIYLIYIYLYIYIYIYLYRYLQTKEEYKKEVAEKGAMNVFIPHKYNNLWLIPGYKKQLQEQYNRCLQLCLGIRKEKHVNKQVQLDLQTLLQLNKLPSNQEYKPFPDTFHLTFQAHTNCVTSISVSPSGEWIATASNDGTVRFWEVATGFCLRTWVFHEPIHCIAFNPLIDRPLLAIGLSTGILIQYHGFGSISLEQKMREQQHSDDNINNDSNNNSINNDYNNQDTDTDTDTDTDKDKDEDEDKDNDNNQGKIGKGNKIKNRIKSIKQNVSWIECEIEEEFNVERIIDNTLKILKDIRIERQIHRFIRIHAGIQSQHWHHRGDYIASVTPLQSYQNLVIHKVSSNTSQYLFTKFLGRIQCVAFHPKKASIVICTLRTMYIYNIIPCMLFKKFNVPVQRITELTIHSSGDHILVGGLNNIICWFEPSISPKPTIILRNHTNSITSIKFHKSYPLLLTSSHDGAVHIFHYKISDNLFIQPKLIPLKILHPHKLINGFSIYNCEFHPIHPWIFTCGTHNIARLYI